MLVKDNRIAAETNPAHVAREPVPLCLDDVILTLPAK
jgi:hypothetical protein